MVHTTRFSCPWLTHDLFGGGNKFIEFTEWNLLLLTLSQIFAFIFFFIFSDYYQSQKPEGSHNV